MIKWSERWSAQNLTTLTGCTSPVSFLHLLPPVLLPISFPLTSPDFLPLFPSPPPLLPFIRSYSRCKALSLSVKEEAVKKENQKRRKVCCTVTGNGPLLQSEIFIQGSLPAWLMQCYMYTRDKNYSPKNWKGFVLLHLSKRRIRINTITHLQSHPTHKVWNLGMEWDWGWVTAILLVSLWEGYH